MTNYNLYSPYAQTPLGADNSYLDLMVSRPVPAAASDTFFIIDNRYNFRPDLLAFELYGSEQLWWVFAERNPNTIKDPVGDFATGVVIYLPDAAALRQSLGI